MFPFTSSQNTQNQLLKSSELLSKLKNIEKSHELIEKKEFEVSRIL